MASVVLLIPFTPEGIQAFRQYGYKLSTHIPPNPTELGIVLNNTGMPKYSYASTGCTDKFKVLIPLHNLDEAMLLFSVIDDSNQLFKLLKALE